MTGRGFRGCWTSKRRLPAPKRRPELSLPKRWRRSRAGADADLFDIGELAEATAKAGNPAIPMVKRLTALVAEADKDAARFVHWGATSQDAMDTGLVLQLRAALAVIDADLDRLVAGLTGLATKHRLTPLVGRTWMQHALPVTFGLKVAGWLDAVKRHQERLGGTQAPAADAPVRRCRRDARGAWVTRG